MVLKEHGFKLDIREISIFVLQLLRLDRAFELFSNTPHFYTSVNLFTQNTKFFQKSPKGLQ